MADMSPLGKDRAILAAGLKSNPYDPTLRLALAKTHQAMGFADLQAHDAYLTIQLFSMLQGSPENEDLARLCPYEQKLPIMYQGVLDYHGIRASNLLAILDATDSIDSTIHALKFEACLVLLDALRVSMSVKEGYVWSRKVMEWYPERDLKCIADSFTKAFTQLMADAKEHAKLIDIFARDGLATKCRTGYRDKIAYPWEEPRLNQRSPALLQDINTALCRSTNVCKVRSLFGASAEDVGALGVFATCDIPAGSVVLADKTSLTVINIPPGKLEHCENCHAVLHKEIIEDEMIIMANCCGRSAYCSTECQEKMHDYHKMNCKQDLSLLYNAATKGLIMNSSWSPLELHRIFSISRAQQIAEKTAGLPITHPLQHPLVAHLTSSYASENSKQSPQKFNWSLETHVILPLLSMAVLKIDPFANTQYSGSGETINTLMNRVEVNACKARTVRMEVGYMNTSNEFQRSDDKDAPDVLVINGVRQTGHRESSWEISGIYPHFPLFNHGCKPNTSWSNVHNDFTDADRNEKGSRGTWLTIFGRKEREWIPHGASTMVMTTCRDVRKGEELTISYLPTGEMDGLDKWFDGGCKCEHCQKGKSLAARKKGKTL